MRNLSCLGTLLAPARGLWFGVSRPSRPCPSYRGLPASVLLLGGLLATSGCGERPPPGAHALKNIQRPTGALRCTFLYREREPTTEDVEPVHQEERTLEVAADTQGVVEVGHLKLEATFWVSDYQGCGVKLEVTAAGKPVFGELHEFTPLDLPLQQLRHGLTGVVYLSHPELGGQYELTCSLDARTPGAQE